MGKTLRKDGVGGRRCVERGWARRQGRGWERKRSRKKESIGTDGVKNVDGRTGVKGLMGKGEHHLLL